MRANIEHIIKLKKKNHLKYWVTYLKLMKFAKGEGFVRYRHYKWAAEKCNLTLPTFKNHIRKLLKLKWIREAQTGWGLISYHGLSGLKRLEITGNSEDELLARAAALAFHKSCIDQICKTSDNDKGLRRRRILQLKRCGAVASKYSVSVRWFMNLFGYKSAASGLKIEKLMEKFKLVRIEQNYKLLFPMDDPNGLFLLNKLYPSKERICNKDGWIAERLLNSISLVH